MGCMMILKLYEKINPWPLSCTETFGQTKTGIFVCDFYWNFIFLANFPEKIRKIRQNVIFLLFLRKLFFFLWAAVNSYVVFAAVAIPSLVNSAKSGDHMVRWTVNSVTFFWNFWNFFEIFWNSLKFFWNFFEIVLKIFLKRLLKIRFFTEILIFDEKFYFSPIWIRHENI